MFRLRSQLTVALAVAAALGISACGPPPPPPPQPSPAPAPTPAPTRSPSPAPAPSLPLCTGTSAGSISAAEDPAPVSGGLDSAVLVATDDSGRPEIVNAELADVGAAAAELTERDLDVIALEGEAPVQASGVVAQGSDPKRAQQWALDHLAIEQAWGVADGDGVDIAVVDTGVFGSHADLQGRLCAGVAYLGATGTAQVGKGAVDPNGHGTHVAGIAAAGRADGVGISGVAPDARLIPVRVLDSSGSGYSSDVARGIIWAVDHGAEVVNLSLGGTVASSSIDAALDYATASGVLVVAAAGNDGAGGPPNYPAAFPEAVAVGSHNSDGTVSSFSTRGDYVDISAPGAAILSTLRSGGWGLMWGTSMATPHVAGAAAVLLSAEPHLGPGDLRARLEAAAVDAGPLGVDAAYGHGRLHLVDALAG